MAATTSGARTRASQNPVVPPTATAMLWAAKAPIMYSEPWATFGTRKTPRMKLKPEETINRIMARLSPTSAWAAMAATVMSCSIWPCSRARRAALKDRARRRPKAARRAGESLRDR